MGVGAILTICYFAEQTLVVILISVLIAFILDPLANLFTRIRVPRSAAAGIAIFLMLAFLGGVTYLGVNKASNLIEELPKHASEIRRDISTITGKAQKIESLTPQEKGTVKIREAPNWADLLSRGFGSLSEGVLAGTFIPFLVFFMLTWQEHARRATVGLVAPENRRAAYVTLGLISGMIRNFML